MAVIILTIALLIFVIIAALEAIVIFGFVHITEGIKQDIAVVLLEEEKYINKISTLQKNVSAKDRRILALKYALISIMTGEDSPAACAEKALMDDRRILDEGR